MKRSTLTGFAALGSAVLLTGCIFPRYTTLEEKFPSGGEEIANNRQQTDPAAVKKTMTAEKASAIVRDMLSDPPAGRRPDYPGDRALARKTTSIRLREHNRTGLVLVEVMEGRRVIMEFYVRTKEDGDRFAEAVWRLRREYREQ